MSEELKPCPFCGVSMVEREHANYAEHPWSEVDDFCHMRGFSVHKSRYGWWNRRASPTPPTTEGEAIKAAKRIVATVAEADAMLVARALLSSPRVEEVRREALEEAAKVADEMAINRARVSGVAEHACKSIASLIRSLSLPDGEGEEKQATRAEDGPTAPTGRLQDKEFSK